MLGTKIVKIRRVYGSQQKILSTELAQMLINRLQLYYGVSAFLDIITISI